jgi:hypothetical protein
MIQYGESYVLPNRVVNFSSWLLRALQFSRVTSQ